MTGFFIVFAKRIIKKGCPFGQPLRFKLSNCELETHV